MWTRFLRVSWLSVRGVLVIAGILGLIETAQGAPSTVDWLADAGVTQNHTLGLILAVIASILLVLVALGPERVRHWRAVARGERSQDDRTAGPLHMARSVGERVEEGDAIRRAERRAREDDAAARATGKPVKAAPEQGRASKLMNPLMRDLHQQNKGAAAERQRDADEGPLERWLDARIEEAERHQRERVVLGDQAYRKAMGEWDFQNVTELMENWSSLVVGYRGSPTGHAPGAASEDAYFVRQLGWLRATLETLHAGVTAESEPVPQGPSTGLDDDERIRRIIREERAQHARGVAHLSGLLSQARQSSGPTSPVKVREEAAARVKAQGLLSDLRGDLEAGKKLLSPIDRPQYAMTETAGTALALGITERDIRAWAKRARDRAVKAAHLAEFDGGADLPAPTAMGPTRGAASREELVTFLSGKIQRLEGIVRQVEGRLQP